MASFSSLAFEAQIAARNLADLVRGRGLRLGITGLSRAGKTVFITALVENFLRQSTLPVLRIMRENRFERAYLQPQPDDGVPRFAIEEHMAALQGADRHWPQSTRRISQLRLTIEFQRLRNRSDRPNSLTLDVIDYPGEWLLDLPLLEKSYPQWAHEMLAASAAAARAPLAAEWRALTLSLDPAAPADEDIARKATGLYTDYLRAARAERFALSTLPPGRFLLPGDLEGSPALTFAPLALTPESAIEPGSLAAMMERRYEAYKTLVVQPFFKDHFARLDRQIVLVDALSALNSGPAAVRDLETALVDILSAFRNGRNSLWSRWFSPRIDKILFAATKADHLHHSNHDRLEAILRHLTARAISRVEGVGARIDVIAMAAIRATREAQIVPFPGSPALDAIIGTPLAGESIDGQIFDGVEEAAIFPGNLPNEPRAAFHGDALGLSEAEAAYRFVRFRPPYLPDGDGPQIAPPHIRLDRALEFLLGDRLL